MTYTFVLDVTVKVACRLHRLPQWLDKGCCKQPKLAMRVRNCESS